MATTGFQAGVPILDFSSLANLPKVYREAQMQRAREQTLAELGKGGDLDYTAAAKGLFAAGDLQGGLSLAQLGEARDLRQRQSQAAEEAYKGFAPVFGGSQPQASSGEPRGIRNNNPLNLEASPFTQRQPGFTGSDGRFGQFSAPEQGMAAADSLLASYGSRGINTISGVINRWAPANDGNPVPAYAQFVARKAGIDPNTPIDLSDPSVRARILPAMAEFENGRPVRIASASGMPPQGTQPQAAQASGATINGTPIAQAVPQAMRVMLNPNAPAGAKDMAKLVLSKAIESNPEITKLEAFRRDPGLMQMAIDLKRAGATSVNVNNTGEKEYEKQAAKDFAEMNRDIIKGAQSSRLKLATLGRLNTLLSDPNIYTGAGANLVLDAKRLAKGLGFDVGEVGGPEAIRAIGNQFALELRNPAGGAGLPGALSDKDRDFLQASVPGLQQSPDGNRLIVDFMMRVAQRSIDVERLRQNYVKSRGRLDEGFYRELEAFSEANPLFPEADQPQQPRQGRPGPQGQQTAPAQVRTPAERDALPSGSLYTAPDGSIRTKR